jgi:hypothetical protein
MLIFNMLCIFSTFSPRETIDFFEKKMFSKSDFVENQQFMTF